MWWAYRGAVRMTTLDCETSAGDALPALPAFDLNSDLVVALGEREHLQRSELLKWQSWKWVGERD